MAYLMSSLRECGCLEGASNIHPFEMQVAYANGRDGSLEHS
jgi:hypothetical protein